MMKSEENTRKSIRRHRQRDSLRLWSKLQVRMTMSYVGVSVVTALLVELLVVLIFIFVIARLPFVFLLSKLAAFTGPGWEQEDDVTLVTLQRFDGWRTDETTLPSATQVS
jgi:hypothetical protein